MTALVLTALPPFVPPLLLGGHVTRFLRIALILSLRARLACGSLFLGGLGVIQSPLSLHQCHSRRLLQLLRGPFVLGDHLIQVV